MKTNTLQDKNSVMILFLITKIFAPATHGKSANTPGNEVSSV